MKIDQGPEKDSIRRLALLSLWGGLLFAGTPHAAEFPTTSNVVDIDGVINAEEWADALHVDLAYETEPGENIQAPVRTTALVMENGQSLYVAFIAEDPDPGAIRAYLRERDNAFDDDFVGLAIDSYGDERRAFQFLVNPLGVQMDLTRDDINERSDEFWNAIWYSAGQITEQGYSVEMEIPFTQIRFPKGDGVKRWKIDFVRIYPREQRFRLASNPQDRGRNCYLCQLDTYTGLEDLEPARDLEIVPTLVVRQASLTDAPGSAPLERGDAEAELGASVRWGITPDLTANLAINPDFSQVEADIPQLAVNNQFALFFPETRPFFLEGADYFTSPINAVYTRTVLQPEIGAKLTGKRDAHTIGVFATRDEQTTLLFPGAQGSDQTRLMQENNNFVARYSYGFGGASTVGALATVRQGDGYHNYVGGFDTRWRINDQHNIRAQVLMSDTEYPTEVAEEFEQPEGSFDGIATTINYRFETRNWTAYLLRNEFSRDFRADAGFIPRVDYLFQVAGLGYEWWAEPGANWAKTELRGDWDVTYDEDGELLEREIEATFEIEGLWQTEFLVNAVNRDLLFTDILFEETQLTVSAEAQPISGLGFGVTVSAGDRVDFRNVRLGDESRLSAFLNWNANRHLLIRLSGNRVNLDTKAGAQIFEASLVDVRLTWQFNVRSFLRYTAQYQQVDRNQDEYIDPVDSQTRDIGQQLLYAWELNPQTVFYLGYSDILVENDNVNNLELAEQSLFMKIGYAFTP